MVFPYLKGFLIIKSVFILFCSLNIYGVSLCKYLVHNTRPTSFQLWQPRNLTLKPFEICKETSSGMVMILEKKMGSC